ncbi:MAG: class I SAM-dependent methyltransferase [Kiritimatiellae bacterium]|nr:class I SAM-dependent methyltransferase [Kiritimatiellia bacterium]
MIAPLIAWPKELFETPLFRDSARFTPPVLPIAVVRSENILRRLRNMPSVSDESEVCVLRGARELAELGRAWLAGLDTALAEQTRRCLQLARRVKQALSGCAHAQPVATLLDRLRVELPAHCRPYLPPPEAEGEGALVSVSVIELLVVDHCMRVHQATRKRYWRRAYRIADEGLQFNSTCDKRRLLPIAVWIRHLIEKSRRTGLAYVDVGCSVTAGAPTLALAAHVLRPGGVCRDIHGTDITPPSRRLAAELARTHHVLVYGCDPVRHRLPRRYDVILLANVHRHLTRGLQTLLLRNLAASLNEAGLLFINWRFAAGASPCVCLRRAGNRMLLAAQANLP